MKPIVTSHPCFSVDALLDLLDGDISSGKNIQGLPGDLAQSMLAYAIHSVDHDEPIEGDVAI